MSGNRPVKSHLQWNLLERGALLLSAGDPTFQSHRDILFRPIARLFLRMRISANFVSILGLTLAIAGSIFIIHPLLAGCLLLASLLLDGIDGVVARLSGTASQQGELLDIFCDSLGILAMVGGLVAYNYLSLSVAAVYALIALSYTFVSAMKSKVLLGKYRSVGSRVATTSYIAACLILGDILPTALDVPSAINAGILAVVFLLVLNLLLDLSRQPLFKIRL